MTFEECVLAKDPECSYPIRSIVTQQHGGKSFWGQVWLHSCKKIFQIFKLLFLILDHIFLWHE